MLNVYGATNGCLTEFPASATDLPPDAVWIDLVEPTANEESKVEGVLGIDIPTREELAEIEASSRLYQEDGAVFMTANLIRRGDNDEPESSPVTFILKDNTLTDPSSTSFGLTVTDLDGDVAARRRDDAHIDMDSCGAADALKVLVDQHAQDLRLGARRHVGDLVEEEDPGVRLLEQPGLGAGPAGLSQHCPGHDRADGKSARHGDRRAGLFLRRAVPRSSRCGHCPRPPWVGSTAWIPRGGWPWCLPWCLQKPHRLPHCSR